MVLRGIPQLPVSLSLSLSLSLEAAETECSVLQYVTVGGVVVTHTALVSVACGLISYYPSTATIVRFWGYSVYVCRAS